MIEINGSSEFEKILAHIFFADYDARIPTLIPYDSPKARYRQFDGAKIYQLENGLVTVKLGIEAKYWKQRVTVEKVDAFTTKLRDCGFDKGIIISAKGFQAGAIESAKRHQKFS